MFLIFRRADALGDRSRRWWPVLVEARAPEPGARWRSACPTARPSFLRAGDGVGRSELAADVFPVCCGHRVAGPQAAAGTW